MSIQSNRDRASIEFIRSHLLELQGMARQSQQSVLAYLIEMAAMEATELLGIDTARRSPEAHNDRATSGDTLADRA